MSGLGRTGSELTLVKLSECGFVGHQFTVLGSPIHCHLCVRYLLQHNIHGATLKEYSESASGTEYGCAGDYEKVGKY